MTARQLARALRRAHARSASKQARYESAARAVLRDLLRTAAARFERSATVFLTAAGDGPGWTPPADDELLSLDEIVGRYRGKTDPIRQSAVADFFAAFGSVAEASGVKANWDISNPLIAAYLARTGSQIENVAETTRTNVRGIIARSYQDGLSVPDTASAIRAYGDSISASRAALIARTEFVGLTRGASLQATQIVSQETGDTYLKRWMTAPGAEYPRHEDYDGLDGQTVPLDGLFEVGDDQLKYPGDPDGDPGEICNCRCDLEYVEAESDADQEAQAVAEIESLTPPDENWLWQAGETRFSLEPQKPPGLDGWVSSLTPDERYGIEHYTGGMYRSLNAWLRGDEAGAILDDATHVQLRDSLDAAIARAPEFREPVTVWRGVNMEGLGMPDSAELAGLRGAEREALINDRMADFWESRYPAGSIIEDPGYASTSFSIYPPHDATLGTQNAGVIFEIQARRGAYLAPLSRYTAEDELLLPRNSRYRVVGVERRVAFEGGDESVFYRTVVKLEQL